MRRFQRRFGPWVVTMDVGRGMYGPRKGHVRWYWYEGWAVRFLCVCIALGRAL